MLTLAKMSDQSPALVEQSLQGLMDYLVQTVSSAPDQKNFRVKLGMKIGNILIGSGKAL